MKAFLMLTGVSAMVLRCFVASQLWTWYALPFGAPLVSTASFFGLLLLKELMFGRTNESKERTDEDVATVHGAWILLSVFYLLFGWLALKVSS